MSLWAVKSSEKDTKSNQNTNEPYSENVRFSSGKVLQRPLKVPTASSFTMVYEEMQLSAVKYAEGWPTETEITTNRTSHL